MDSSNPLYIYILDHVVITPNAINNYHLEMVKKPPTHKNGAIKGMVFTWHFWFTACEIHGIKKKI